MKQETPVYTNASLDGDIVVKVFGMGGLRWIVEVNGRVTCDAIMPSIKEARAKADHDLAAEIQKANEGKQDMPNWGAF